jgi:hypothetical protein
MDQGVSNSRRQAYMKTEFDRLYGWLGNIYRTQPEEIDCSALYEALARFVDLRISGEDAARILPLVQQHLDQCPNCYDLYDALKAVAQKEVEGRLLEVSPPWEQPGWPG